MNWNGKIDVTPVTSEMGKKLSYIEVSSTNVGKEEEEANLNEKWEISPDKDIVTWPLALKRDSSVHFFSPYIKNLKSKSRSKIGHGHLNFKVVLD